MVIAISRWCDRIASLAGPSPSSTQPTPTAKEHRVTTWKPRPCHRIPPDTDGQRASCSCLFVVQQRPVQPAYALGAAGGRLTGRCEDIRQLFHRKGCEAPARNPPVACARPFFARDRRAQRPVVHWCGRWCTAPTRIPPSRCSMWTRQQRAAAGTRSEGPVRLSPARRRVARRWRRDQERRVSP